METVKTGFMRWKTACRWDKGGNRDAGLDLSGTGFGTDDATKNVLLSLVTPKGQIFVLMFSAGFPAGMARCTAAPGDGQHGLSSFTDAVNGKLTDVTDVTKISYKSLAPYLPEDPTLNSYLPQTHRCYGCDRREFQTMSNDPNQIVESGTGV